MPRRLSSRQSLKTQMRAKYRGAGILGTSLLTTSLVMAILASAIVLLSPSPAEARCRPARLCL